MHNIRSAEVKTDPQVSILHIKKKNCTEINDSKSNVKSRKGLCHLLTLEAEFVQMQLRFRSELVISLMIRADSSPSWNTIRKSNNGFKNPSAAREWACHKELSTAATQGGLQQMVRPPQSPDLSITESVYIKRLKKIKELKSTKQDASNHLLLPTTLKNFAEVHLALRFYKGKYFFFLQFV